jgi:hypothetical protein
VKKIVDEIELSDLPALDRRIIEGFERAARKALEGTGNGNDRDTDWSGVGIVLACIANTVAVAVLLIGVRDKRAVVEIIGNAIRIGIAKTARFFNSLE